MLPGCGICLFDFDSLEREPFYILCGHVFCFQCTTRLTSDCHSCPFKCRDGSIIEYEQVQPMGIKILPHTPAIHAGYRRREQAHTSNFLFTRGLEALHMANFLELKRVAEACGRIAESAVNGEELLGRIESLLRDESQLLLDQDDVLVSQKDLLHVELQYVRRLSCRDRESRDGGEGTAKWVPPRLNHRAISLGSGESTLRIEDYAHASLLRGLFFLVRTGPDVPMSLKMRRISLPLPIHLRLEVRSARRGARRPPPQDQCRYSAVVAAERRNHTLELSVTVMHQKNQFIAQRIGINLLRAKDLYLQLGMQARHQHDLSSILGENYTDIQGLYLDENFRSSQLANSNLCILLRSIESLSALAGT
ncbi:hypothetical protein FA13DRAFT_1715916 [Coprinellus micaceus]|uniref:RING-type domain-containing protein n=1 Tax=Coprinellus micaceus TaxID=71717 RepID=A0A4Y7SL82_COPMI|nr:hypothetical protein FA13DRAFT_1715916 [Coprinellus micaceus]